LRNWLIAGAATVVATLLCVFYVDRPLVEYFEIHLRHTEIWNVLHAALFAVVFVPVAAMVFLFACGAWVVSGRSLSRSARVPLLCSWATMWALGAEAILKPIFGRGWPDPTYLREHLYAFRPLQGIHEHWNSFPSGTALVSWAIAAVLWNTVPALRFTAVAFVTVLCVVMVVMNLHWLGDMLPGIFLGASIGWMTARLQAFSGER
jgi:hypothetical protein